MKSGVLGAAKNIAVGLGGIFAAEKAFDFGKEAVQQAALVQKAGESVKITLGNQASVVEAFANQAASKFGIAEGASLQFSSAVGLMGRQIGLTHEQSANMSTSLQALAGSVGLIKGVDPTTYFDSLQKAVLGNTRGFKQLGIAVTPVDEKAAALTLHIKGQSSAWTDAQKAMILTQVATSKLGPLMDQAKKTSGDWSDQMIILRAQLQNVEEHIGSFLLPIVQKLTTFIAGQVVPAVQKWWDILHAKLQPVVQTVSQFLDKHSATIKDVGKAAAVAIPVIGGLTLAFGLLAGAVALLTSPVTLILALGVAAVYAYEHWKPFRQIVNEVVTYLQKNAIPDLRAFYKFLTTTTQAAISEVLSIWHRFSLVRTIVEDVLGYVKTVVKNDLTIVKDIVHLLLDLIHGDWSGAWSSFRGIVAAALGNVVAAVKLAAGVLGAAAARAGLAILSGIRNNIARLPGAISSILGGLIGLFLSFEFRAASLLYDAGVALMQGLLNGIKHAFDAVKNFVSGIASDIASLKGPLDYDRQLLIPHGIAIMQGLHEGLTTGFGPVKTLVGGMAPQLASGAQGGVAVGGVRQFHFAPGSIVIHDARDPGATARAILDEAVLRAR